MIRILFADESQHITSNVMKRLEREDGIALCGTARDGEFAFQEAIRLKPDVAIIDASLPGMDGLQTTELLSQHLPYTGIILTSLDSENDAYRQAMYVGAREFLQKPYRGDDLIAAVRRVFEFEQKRQTISQSNSALHDAQATGSAAQTKNGALITVLSGQGGSGKSLIATNLAIDLKRLTNERVILLDLSLQFGDIGALLNLPSQRTIVDLATNDAVTDMESIEQAIVKGPEGIDVLLAPLSPEQADYVTTSHLRVLIENLRQEYTYLVADTASYLSEITLDAIEMSDFRVVVFDPSLTGTKNAHLFMQVLNVLNVEPETITLVMNYRETGPGLDQAGIESFLHMAPHIVIPYDGVNVSKSQVTSTPITLLAPSSPATAAINGLGQRITGEEAAALEEEKQDAGKKKQRRFFGFVK